MSQHNRFILTPVSEIFSESIFAIQCLGHGIETFPISNYVMQSIFIRMAGAQEQKLKCIHWELANNDFDFRVAFLKDFSSMGFSLYRDKQHLYKVLIRQIKEVVHDFNLKNFKEDKDILRCSTIDNIISMSLLSKFHHREYINYKEIWSGVEDCYFLNQDTVLLETPLKSIYDSLYKNRNRIAHNTKSYQHNLPTLNSLLSADYKYENYFLWFSILILIDHIFIELYKEYLDVLDQRKFI